MGKSNFQVTRQIATRRRTTSHPGAECSVDAQASTKLLFLESLEIPVASPSFPNGLYASHQIQFQKRAARKPPLRPLDRFNQLVLLRINDA